MELSRKRGKLSNEEMAYIEQNCFDLSLQEIADHPIVTGKQVPLAVRVFVLIFLIGW